MIERACPWCGTTYFADPKRLKWGRQTTCSRACSYALRGAGSQRTVRRVCQQCGHTFARKPGHRPSKYLVVCSHACYVAAARQGALPRRQTKPVVTYICETCGVPVEVSAARKGARRFRFCSAACANVALSGSGNPAWRGGHPGYYGPDWRSLRRAARRRDNRTCRRCAIPQLESRRAPDVHHIIPVSSFADPNDANTLENVVCLCKPCHAYVEWHGLDFAL